MERSIGKTFKYSRYLNTGCLFYIYVRIFTQIYVFLKNSTWYNWLFTSYWSNIKITFYTNYHTFSDAERALLLFLVKLGGLELKNLYEIADIELLNSKETIRELYKIVITQNKDFQIDNWKNNKKSRDYKRLLFLSKPLRMNMRNQGSKENLGVKFKEGICVKLCSKVWFESGWVFL